MNIARAIREVEGKGLEYGESVDNPPYRPALWTDARIGAIYRIEAASAAKEGPMRTVVQFVVGVMLFGFGWAIGRVQNTEPDFELIVRAPAGETTIECSRGCTLAWVERGVNPRSKPSSSFTFACSGASVRTCASGKIGGWSGK
jgi:hypothetical protein